MGRKMTPHKRPKRFGTGSNSYLVGVCARQRGMPLTTNPYRQGTDDYKRWKKGWREGKQ